MGFQTWKIVHVSPLLAIPWGPSGESQLAPQSHLLPSTEVEPGSLPTHSSHKRQSGGGTEEEGERKREREKGRKKERRKDVGLLSIAIAWKCQGPGGTVKDLVQ